MHLFQRSAFSICHFDPVLFQKLGRDSVAGNERAGKRAVVYRSAAAGRAVRLEHGSFDAEKLCARPSAARAPFSNCSVTSAPVFETTLSPRRSDGVRGVGSPPQHSGTHGDKLKSFAQRRYLGIRHAVIAAVILAVKAQQACGYQNFLFHRLLSPSTAPQTPPIICVSCETLSLSITPSTISLPR